MGQKLEVPKRSKSEIRNISVRGGELHREFSHMKEGKERLSIAQLRKTIKKDKRSLSAEDEKLKELFPDQTEIDFRDFLRWKMKSVNVF